MDTMGKTDRSALMSRIRGDNLGPESRLAAALDAAGADYERNVADLPGKPDFELEAGDRALAVFVHGCFWHGCPRHYRRPKTRVRWWADKVASNRARDARVRSELRAMFHSTMVVWEHDVRTAAAARRAAERVMSRVERLKNL